MYVPDNTREVVFSETEMDKADYEGPNSIGPSIIMHWLLLGEERIQECHARVRSASSFHIHFTGYIAVRDSINSLRAAQERQQIFLEAADLLLNKALDNIPPEEWGDYPLPKQ